ncbi:MAG: hypothetical protein F6J86_37460 [Symploca sp. SIO1B1]|nr:hypothetical protein [Symploca sp. SIO1B1]
MEVSPQWTTDKCFAQAIAIILTTAGIELTLIAGVQANEIGKAHPQLKPHMEAAYTK